jgi:hypothetical protein
MIRIKDEFIDEEQISLVSFNGSDKEIIIHFKNGAMLPFGAQLKQGLIPRQRVLTDAEYEKVKDYFAIEKKAQVIV